MRNSLDQGAKNGTRSPVLKMKDVEISDLNSLKVKFSPEILFYFRSGCLSKWLLSQGLLAEFDAISDINRDSPTISQLKSICHVFDLNFSELTMEDFVWWDEFFKKVGSIPSESKFPSTLELARTENRSWV